MPVVALEGEFDIETVPEIDRFLRRTFGPFFYKQHVVLDLSGVTLIDSAFVAFVVGLLDRLHGERKELVLTRPGGHVWRILSMVGVPNAVPVYDSIEEAIAVIRTGMLPIIPPAFAAGRLGGSVGGTPPD